ncbi:hypothetical protein [Lederbergia citri]|nr:hypothetical protein [Lederbergia citri]
MNEQSYSNTPFAHGPVFSETVIELDDFNRMEKLLIGTEELSKIN